MRMTIRCIVLLLVASAAIGVAQETERPASSPGSSAATADTMRTSDRPQSVDTVQVAPRVPHRILPRRSAPVRPHPGARRHTMEVRIEELRAAPSFTPIAGQLRRHDYDAARHTLEAVRDTARDPLHRQLAAFDRIEVDFYEGDFDTAEESYKSFARAHKRGYLTNDAIARLFLIGDNSDNMRKPLRFFARAELYARVGEVDSAIATSRTALVRFPETSLVDDLNLQLGDLTLLSATPEEALQYYRAVADSMPESPLSATALMRVGHFYHKIERDIPAAIDAYEEILERFPESLEAPEARKILEGLRRRT